MGEVVERNTEAVTYPHALRERIQPSEVVAAGRNGRSGCDPLGLGRW